MRLAARIIIGAVTAIALGYAPSCVIASPHGGVRSGEAVGSVLFERGAHGVVKVFDASDRLVNRRDLRWGHSHFRFALKPGHYEFKLELPRRWVVGGCERYYVKAVAVRANKTTRVRLSQGCDSTY
jgi:hypothetical protein